MDRIAKVYDSNTEREWQRLVRDPYHSLELHTTLQSVYKNVAAGSTILDAGGGPGRYAIELCRTGYRVVLLDLSPGNIQTAQRKFADEPESVRDNLLDSAVGDVRDLSRFDQHRFDAVLCLGPLSHIDDVEGRRTAIRELMRVTSPGGVVAISVSGYYAMLRTVLLQVSDELLDPAYQLLMDRGDNTVSGMLWHFFRADELRRLAESCGLHTVAMLGCEGLSSSLREATNQLAKNEAKWQRWLDLVMRMATDPAVVDMAEHILFIGRT
jgi:ubiquinone/menaquinone biosynthesis C-methylase UbiE